MPKMLTLNHVQINTKLLLQKNTDSDNLFSKIIGLSSLVDIPELKSLSSSSKQPFWLTVMHLSVKQIDPQANCF